MPLDVSSALRKEYAFVTTAVFFFNAEHRCVVRLCVCNFSFNKSVRNAVLELQMLQEWTAATVLYVTGIRFYQL